MPDKFTVYADGLCYCSVCTNLPAEKVADRANAENPTGTRTRWELSEDRFKTGEPNPCQCEKDPECKHYLLVC